MRPLGWFRSNNGTGVWLAFFALACQLVLTFGHGHFVRTAAISAALASTVDPAVDGTTAPASPEQPAQTGLAQDFCTVCNNIGLANTLVVPAPPDLDSPVAMDSGPRRAPVPVERVSQHRFQFSARGPPRA